MTASIPDIQCPPTVGSHTDAMDLAEAACRARGASLTAIRREVLELLYLSPTGVKAYDLLAQIKEARPGASPPTIYRALDFLIEQGLTHKIGRMNLFVACRHALHHIPSLFLVCPKCSGVTELQEQSVMSALSTSLAAAGHRLESPEVEISALCPKCFGAQ
ncbi:MAG: Zinc uptake regulation protein [Nitrosomonadaceae bacterium]|nr:Zinc uptake regulation protein [Nitrosomonadaceae bacterium]MSQ45212.1 transcriptional repressor [Nitrosomonadaceae bacterium]